MKKHWIEMFCSLVIDSIVKNTLFSKIYKLKYDMGLYIYWNSI
jgi:hypothetical protein